MLFVKHELHVFIKLAKKPEINQTVNSLDEVNLAFFFAHRFCPSLEKYICSIFICCKYLTEKKKQDKVSGQIQ